VEKIHQNIQPHSFGRGQMKNEDDDDVYCRYCVTLIDI
jgi:hypothetical protein